MWGERALVVKTTKDPSLSVTAMKKETKYKAMRKKVPSTKKTGTEE